MVPRFEVRDPAPGYFDGGYTIIKKPASTGRRKK
jgi:hypothetical protein